MSDTDFWLLIRRAALMIAHAIEKRYHFTGLLVLLTGNSDTK